MRIVAIGDSVVWGQGLLHGDKFVEIVAQELGGDLEVPRDFLAHSGATIGSVEADGCPGVDPEITDFIARGEVPCEGPNLGDQLAAIEAPDSVDLLVLDGGANDLEGGFFNTLVDFLKTLPGLERKVGRAFMGVRATLTRARRTCRNAVIVYTGYYAGVSRRTDTRVLDKLALYSFLSGNPLSGLGLLGIRNSIIINNLFFGHDQLRRIRDVVAELMSDPELRGPGILFAHPRFASTNALGARGGDSWVELALGSFSNDAQFDVREEACGIQHGRGLDAVMDRIDEAFEEELPANPGPELLALQQEAVGNPMDRYTCQIAASFHPNAEGARVGYARAIVDVFRSNEVISLAELAEELAPRTRSLRRGLTRYGLSTLTDREGRLSLRDANQHRVVDVLMVAVQPGDREGPFGGGEGTDHDIHLDVGPRSWHLTRAAGRSRRRHPLDEFQASDEAHLFTVDPSYDPENGTGEGEPLRLSDMSRVRIRKVADQPTVSPDFFLGNVHLTLNERVVIYDAGRGSDADDPIGKALTNQDPTWTSGEDGTPKFPLPEER